jgi:K+ transporter
MDSITSKHHFTLKLIMLVISLYFIFDFTDSQKDIDTVYGIAIILGTTFMVGLLFIYVRKQSTEESASGTDINVITS